MHAASDKFQAARMAYDYAEMCRQSFIWHKNDEPHLVMNDPNLFTRCQAFYSSAFQATTGPEKNEALNLRFIRAEDVGQGEYRAYLQGQAVYDDIYRRFDDGRWYNFWQDPH